MIVSSVSASHPRPQPTASTLRVGHVVLSMDFGGLESIVLDLVRESQRLQQGEVVICLERTGAVAAQVEALGARVDCVHKPPGIRLETFGRLEKLLRRASSRCCAHTPNRRTVMQAGPRRAGVPLVVHTEHGKHYSERSRTRWVGRLAGRHAAPFLCVSADIAAAVRSNRIVPPDKLHVVPNGVEIDRFRSNGDAASVRHSLGIPPGAPVIGTVGRLCEIKRQDLLVRAFNLVLDAVPGAHLLLVGDGPWMDQLRELVAGLGLAERVHFTGYQARPKRLSARDECFRANEQFRGDASGDPRGVGGRTARGRHSGWRSSRPNRRRPDRGLSGLR